MGGGAADFGGLVVHHLDKRLLAPGDRLGQGHARVVAALEQQAVHEVAHRDALALLQIDGALADHDVFGNGHDLVQVQVLQGEDGGHDLCGGSGIDFAVRFLAEEHAAAADVHGHGACGVEHVGIQALRMIGVVIRRVLVGICAIIFGEADLRQEHEQERQRQNPANFQPSLRQKNHPSQQGIFYEYSTKARSCTAQVCLRVVSTRHFPAETRGKRGECEGER